MVRPSPLPLASFIFLTALGCDAEDTSPPSPSEPASEPPVVVFVHGAWHSPDQWDAVGAALDARGVEWVAVDLPTAGPEYGTRLEPNGEEVATVPLLSADVAETVAVLDAVGRSTILVGHSYGGFVLSQAGHHPSVEQLVFLCAFVPEQGESLVDLASTGPVAPIVGALRLSEDRRLLSIDPELAPFVFYGDLSDSAASAATEKLVPSIALTFDEPAGYPAWKDVPSTMVRCLDDNAIHPERQAQMGAKLDRMVDLPSSHSPFLSRPEEVADILVELAQPER
jgi:pimeloyl-ACP methyl ester carboxylesterase